MSDVRCVHCVDTRFGGTRDIWWPIYEADPQGTFKYIQARVTDVDITAKLCKKRRTVVQAGGHIGLFPLRLATMFDDVISFEPDPSTFSALVMNTHGKPNIKCFNRALGEAAGSATLALKYRSGAATIVNDGRAGVVSVEMITIDSLAVEHCDALVIDVEHYECEVLKGARDTITRCSPVIHVEELPRRRDELQALIKSLGYVERRRVHGDAIYTRG